MTDPYLAFLASKAVKAPMRGLMPAKMPSIGEHLFPFQRACVQHALRVGAAGVFLDTGLGKTLMQLAWSDEVARHTGGIVLIMAPLAVSEQTIEQVATWLNVARSTVYLMLERGELPVVRIGRSVRIRPEDVREYLERNTGRAGARR